MKKSIQVLLLAISIVWFRAVHAKEANWYTGTIKLLSNQTMEGEVSYNPEADVVQFKGKGIVKAFSARSIQSFGYFDTDMNMFRRFLALSYKTRPTYQTKMFFEIVLTGHMYLVRRKNNSMDFLSSSSFSQGSESEKFYDTINGFTYYVYSGHQFINIKKFRKEIWPSMQAEFGEELKAFIRENHINKHLSTGKFRIINYYNTLKDPSLIAFY
jgi:hypothetical protein